MKKYIASFTNAQNECWDLVINANTYAEARKEARKAQREYGKLYSVRMVR